MFGTHPKLIGRGVSSRYFRKMRAYYRLVSGYKPQTTEGDGLTVTHEGFQPEKDSVIIG